MGLEYAPTHTSKPIERRMASTVAAQFGVFSREQALRAGMSRSAIQGRLASGRWEAMFPGVLREPGSPRTWHQLLAAAWLATGERGVISHRAAAALWALTG